MQGRYAMLVVFQGAMTLVALLLQLTALSQPLFAVYRQTSLGSYQATVMGFEDQGLYYFTVFLALVTLTAFTKITRLRWPNALRSTPLLAYAVAFLIILSAWSLWSQMPLGLFEAAHYRPLEGFYTYCLSYFFLVSALAFGPPIATRMVSLPGARNTA